MVTIIILNYNRKYVNIGKYPRSSLPATETMAGRDQENPPDFLDKQNGMGYTYFSR